MSKTSCFIFHDWDRWEQYTWKGKKAYASNPYYSTGPVEYYPYTEERQRRVCKRCGYTQDIPVSED